MEFAQAQAGATEPALWLRVSSLSSSASGLSEILPEFVTALSADAGVVFYYDPAAVSFQMLASHPPMQAPETGVSMAAEPLVTVQVITGNLQSDERFEPLRRVVGGSFAGLISAPLVANGEFLGIFVALYCQPKSVRNAPALAEFIGHELGLRIAMSSARAEAQKLKDDLESRKMVERAKGILMRMHSLTEEEAYLRLRGESRRMRKPMRDLAHAIIMAEQLRAQAQHQ